MTLMNLRLLVARAEVMALVKTASSPWFSWPLPRP
jgi:hypothetical protein